MRLAVAPDFPFDPDLLRHVSPIEWKNVVLYGEIKIDPAKLKVRGPWRVFQRAPCEGFRTDKDNPPGPERKRA